MMTHIRNPNSGIYRATDDYIHAMEVELPSRFLFVSGTMGLREDGTPGRNLAEQLDLIWGNIRRILAEAGMGMEHIIRVTSYLRDADFVQQNQDARVAALDGRAVPVTTIVAQTLSAEWLVEIEVIAAA